MKNILLVDDDEIINFLNRKMLERLGINQVDAAMNGQQAIDLINGYFQGSRAIPDIIFLDLSMPIMDGFNFIEAFKKLNLPNKEKVMIIIVTSSQDPKDIARAKEMGITHYLSKPVSENELKAILEL